MAKMGTEIKAEMKTLMAEMKTATKTNQERLGVRTETYNDKYEVLRENMCTNLAEMKTRISIPSPGWIFTKPGQRPLKKK
jgi:hypothetical protein